MKGNILLGVCLVIFLASLAAAGGVWYKLNFQKMDAPATATSPTPVDQRADVLNPTVKIDEEVKSEQAHLQTNLIGPLRQYYATQPEHLTTVHVKKSRNAEKFPLEVQLTVVNPEGNPRTIPFLYDLSRWKPSMLDNAPTAE